MAFQQTLVLCKADAVARGLVGEIIARFERRGYMILGMKFGEVDEELAKRQYAEHEGKPFYQTLINDLVAGPLLAFVVSGDEAVKGARQIIGDADPHKASPGSIRADYAPNIRHNVVHASDTPESARREIGIWFKEKDLWPRENPLEVMLEGD
jgi:nucleoside-diphosphate kinase